MNAAGIAGIVAAILTGVAGLFTAIWTRRKVSAEAESVSIATMQQVIKSVRAEMSRLADTNENMRLQISELEHTNQALAFRVAKLEKWIITQGHDPTDINGH